MIGHVRRATVDGRNARPMLVTFVMPVTLATCETAVDLPVNHVEAGGSWTDGTNVSANASVWTGIDHRVAMITVATTTPDVTTHLVATNPDVTSPDATISLDVVTLSAGTSPVV